MKSIRVIISIWVAWVFIVIGLQALATARMSVQYPDHAQDWTEEFTAEGYQEGHVFQLEPFMNNQVAWDSGYYLAIAVGGYDDPRSSHLTPRGVSMSAEENLAEQSGSDLHASISLSYAFFPLNPFVMRLFAFPLQVFGMNPIAKATLAVVLISWGSGPAQGIHRYVLGAPAVLVALAKWGGSPVFDRAWTILSILLMDLNATLFAFSLWVA